MITSACSFPLTATSKPYEPFIFVRHGSTDWSLETIQQGVQNLSLNERGKAEAALAADILISVINTDEPSYIIISSPLQRAADTTAIIAIKHIFLSSLNQICESAIMEILASIQKSSSAVHNYL